MVGPSLDQELQTFSGSTTVARAVGKKIFLSTIIFIVLFDWFEMLQENKPSPDKCYIFKEGIWLASSCTNATLSSVAFVHHAFVHKMININCKLTCHA